MIQEITSPPGGSPNQDDAQFADYLIVGWRYRWLILLLTVGGGMVGLIASRALPPSYEAAVVVSFVPRAAGQPGATTAGDVQALFRSQALAAGALAHLGLDKPPYNISGSALAADQITVDTVPNTYMLRIRVRLDQSERAASVANELVRGAVNANTRATQSESAAVLERSRAAVQRAKAHLDDIEAQFVRLQTAREFGRLPEEIEELGADRANLKNVAIEIGAQRAKVAAVEQALKQPANALSERLQYAFALQQGELAGLIERQRELAERIGRPLAEQKLEALYARDARLSRVAAERTAAQATYASLTEQSWNAENAAADSTPQLQVVDSAIPPASPVSPGAARLVMMGVLTGMFVGIVVALAVNYVKVLTSHAVKI